MNTRRLPAAVLILLAASAAVVAAVVIPAVRLDPFPGGAPDRAERALWIIVGSNLVLGVFAFTLGHAPTAFATLIWRLAACSIALPALLIALALLDGGFAYWSHGPAMRSAAIAMFIGAATDVGAALLIIALGLGRHTDRGG